jgi:hypothetical protein
LEQPLLVHSHQVQDGGVELDVVGIHWFLNDGKSEFISCAPASAGADIRRRSPECRSCPDVRHSVLVRREYRDDLFRGGWR